MLLARPFSLFRFAHNSLQSREKMKCSACVLVSVLLYDAPAAAASSACTDGWNILQSYDLFSAGDVWTSSETEGKTFIGGDLTSSNSANFGIHLSSTTDVTMEIAGSISSGNPLNLNKGSLVHSPDVSSYLQNPAVGVSNPFHAKCDLSCTVHSHLHF